MEKNKLVLYIIDSLKVLLVFARAILACFRPPFRLPLLPTSLHQILVREQIPYASHLGWC